VWLEGAAPHRLGDGPAAGLLIGYANVAEAAIERGIALLGDAVR
jgi:hypothetical protein